VVECVAKVEKECDTSSIVEKREKCGRRIAEALLRH
jgi:hypothetical protein